LQEINGIAALLGNAPNDFQKQSRGDTMSNEVEMMNVNQLETRKPSCTLPPMQEGIWDGTVAGKKR